ncbi:MAG: hypothetical protein QM763_16940 [Agriterribacter sp.]
MRFSKGFLPIGALFIILTGLFLLFSSTLRQYNFDIKLLLWGNLFLFLLSSISFFIQYNALKASNPQAFTRYFYLSFVIKFILVAITVLVYSLNTKAINRNAILLCMGLYLVYVFIEMSFVLKSLRKK